MKAVTDDNLCTAEVQELVLQYKMSGHPAVWNSLPELVDTPEVAYRDEFATRLASAPVERILGSTVFLTADQMKTTLDLARENLDMEPLRGVGLELGAGTGLLSATLVRCFPAIETVLALELCRQFAQEIIPRVSASILNGNGRSVVPVIGTFDDLMVPDESLDFVVDFHSLHHSHDLPASFAEAARVLKKGGSMLIFDRVQPNSLTDDEVEAMLSETYSNDFLVRNCYPPDTVLTRRENGEHEYRLWEWEEAIDNAGLKLKSARRFQTRVSTKRALRVLARPLTARNGTSNSGSRFKPAETWLRQRLPFARVRDEFGEVVVAPRKTTAMFLKKES